MGGIMGLYDPIPISKLKIINPNEPLITKQLNETLWKRRIDKMVKVAKEAMSSQWAAPILLSLLLGYTVWSNQAYSATLANQQKQLDAAHDLLIELRTLKDVDTKERGIERDKTEREREMDSAWRENIRKDFTRLELIVQGKYPKEN